MNSPRAPLPPIDFVSLAAALLERSEQLVSTWLRGGHRRGHEWVCGGLDGSEGGSLSVNLRTGAWADFATDDKGGDLISLYAAINGLNNGQAAHRLMQELGWQRTPAPAVQAPVAPAVAAAEEARRKSPWRPIVPVPEHAPQPTFRHHARDRQEIEASWAYRFEGKLYGHVVRFRTSDGGKEILPHTWCVDESDGQGTQRWHWIQWAVPRPLYVPAERLAEDPAARPVALVEGEKCAMAGHQLLPGDYDWVSWPGGSNAADKADWTWLRGRTVVLWPDCDAKRVKLSRAEQQAGVDPASKPLLPEDKQPGVKAMSLIARLLQGLGCTLLMVRLPRPGEVADGWDVADAIASGWGVEEVGAFLRSAQPYAPSESAAGVSTPASAGAGSRADSGPRGPREPYWRDALIHGKLGPLAVRENLMAALHGVETRDGMWLPGVKALQGVIAFNEFTNDVVKTRDAPWGTPAGVWHETDELLLGEWLVRQHDMPSCSRGTIEEAVRMVAARHAYHPVRAYLEVLKWDGHERLRTWIRQCCLEEDEWDDTHPLQRYLARVGTWFLQGMVARVMQPGVKWDYMLILEGKQGLRKSTLLKTLAGDYFADTGLVLGDKDSYQQLQGRWLYEFAELDSFGKAEVTKIKSFIASASDYFRASFDRRARDYPRQLVFGGTTNEDHYLTDPTGNRRFWPVRVTRVIDIDWLAENRDQLFAEAMVRWREGARMHPTLQEEETLFAPQQRLREVENAIASAIATYLDSEKGELVREITAVGILQCIGIDVAKLGPGRWHEKQATAALRAMGWTEGGRSPASVPGRPRKWVRPRPDDQAPAVAPADSRRASAAHDNSEAPDVCPF